MLIHRGCGGSVFPVQTLQIRCGTTLTTKGLILAGVGRISKLKGPKVTILFCDCGEQVQPEDITEFCMQCGNPFGLSDLNVLESQSGIYCDKCTRTYYPEEKVVNALVAIKKS